MFLKIYDGIPGIGAGREMQHDQKGNRRDALTIAAFSPIRREEPGILAQDLSNLVRANVSSLVHLIDNAEREGYNAVNIEGSPLRYVAYAQLTGRSIDQGAIDELTRITELLRARAEVLLYHPSQMRAPSPKQQMILPIEIPAFDTLLSDTYEGFFTREKVKHL